MSVVTEWNVPFKPHAALLFTVHKTGASLPVPQPPKFVEAPGDNQGEGGEKVINEVLAMFEPPNKKEQDVQWGRTVARLEADLQMTGKGRGWCFPVKREPLVEPTAPDKAWQGGKVAFWERIQLWIQQRQERPLKPSQVRLFIRQLQHIKHMLEPAEQSKAEFLRTELENFVIGHPTNMTLVNTVVANAKEAAREWRNRQQEGYQAWLQGAVEGGMRGLYKSLKKPENIQARPYREASSELRPHLRRQEWKQVWKPQADNSPEDHHLFEELRHKAAEELRQVGPLTNKQVEEALRKMAKKACGPDGLTCPMLKTLEPDQVALVVTKAVRRRPGWKSEDLLQPLREAKERLHLTWVNSHLTQQEFACKFGEAALWRWRSNQLVDELVQNKANGCRDMQWEQKVLISDEVVIRVNNLLASRAEELLQADSSQGPQIIFPDRLSHEETEPSKKTTKGPRQAKIIKFSSKARPKTQAPGPGDTKPNKRRQMEAMLDGAGPNLGHTWVVGHKSRDQLTIKCSTCGLYVEQTEPVKVFDKKAHHHCLFQGPPFPLPAHGSHRIVNGGRAWLCTKCGLKQWVNQDTLSGALSKECRQRYQGKDPWVKGIIQKEAPKTSFFQPRVASSVSPTPQAIAPAQPRSSGVSQTTEIITQGGHATEHDNTWTSDGDAGDEGGAGYAGGGVVPNQRTSDKAVPKTKGDKPKAKNQPPQRSLALAPNRAQTGPVSQSSGHADPQDGVPCIESVPKAKPRPKTPGRARPQSVDPKQTRLKFK